ncbi:phage tail protein [Chitinophaga pinensis]|uniref:Tail Collar domain protein n=1 Tax=Chitinophaga pinensis (strain ATCC 43595 / DSM 2588 / LMG 13176 / NBRC 15968 / NCIMB 11800 / UQM 2034) TaxID=485918 RepID=A0A979G979_CHIPD|nr:tail fiber protein [Chitinophaga pinensis]ACU63284.1 Tail Collar domain protein [Chitinophaga pinensis DSM 2588]
MDSFMGIIFLFGESFAPVNWHLCDGTQMAISGNEALFSLLGTTYGGDGMTTFALPDLRGRTPIGTGQGPGLSSYVQGQMAGTEQRTLIMTNLPAHNHVTVSNLTINPAASTAAATTNIPGSTLVEATLPNIGSGPAAQPIKGYAVGDSTAILAPSAVSGSVTIGIAGGSQPFSIQRPYLAMNYGIALYGIYPSRN